MIFEYIIKNFGEAKFTEFLNSIKHVPVDSGLEVHLDCELGHFHTTLDTKESIPMERFGEIYATFWDLYNRKE